MISLVPRNLRPDSQTAAALLLLRQQQIALGDMITGVWTAENLVQAHLLHCRTFRFMCIKLHKYSVQQWYALLCFASTYTPFDRPSLVKLELTDKVNILWGTCLKCFTADVEETLSAIPCYTRGVTLTSTHTVCQYVYIYVFKLSYMCEPRVIVLPSVRVLQRLHVLDKRQLFASPPA